MNSDPRIHRAVEALRRVIREGTVPAKVNAPPSKAEAAPIGPKGLPGSTTNLDTTMDHQYDEGLSDPGVINGVTATGGGAIIN